MISLILPYWDRQEAADRAFKLLDAQYSDLDLEVIVVDDGNQVPFRIPQTRLNVRVVRLPMKPHPTPQSRAWNAGVREAKSDIVVLSCIEILHESPVLCQMYGELEKIGKDGYVLAAAFCPEENRWHCHSTEHIPSCPEGTGPSFCGMLHKDLFYRAGGFAEVYHDGAGYEDKDFIWRMHEAGAQFCIRDDLVVIHPKSGATIQWKPEGFRRNADIYFSKWHKEKPVTFVCLKAGDAYSSDYVNILFDMVRRNLKQGYPGRFVCLTDDPSGLSEGIETIHLPEDLETWWGKLYMFKRGLFEDGERLIFMDLDTLIVGNLDQIVKYNGKFACLRDFYHPERLGPAVMMWEAGEFSAHIWEEWEAQGKPRHQMGDLWWLNSLDGGEFVKSIDIIQTLYPARFVSYKAHCNPYPPKLASVVCFHGQPKPSNCSAEWVKDVWRINGGGMPEIEVVANTQQKIVLQNVSHSSSLDIPWLEMKQKHDGHIVVVAGGPSLKDTIGEVRMRHEHGQKILAVNGAAKFLNEHGIEPDYQIVIDAREENSKFIKEAKAKHYLLASQCSRDLFDLAGEKCTLFHLNTLGIIDAIPDNPKPVHLISSGSTAGLAAIVVAYTQGYRNIHLHGFDSSYSDYHHAYSQSLNDEDKCIEVSVNGEKFKCAPWMLVQAQEFQQLAAQLVEDDVILTVAGNGLLPYIARCMASEVPTD